MKRLYVALDFSEREACEAFLQAMGPHRHVKIGMEIFYRLGPDYVRDLADRGYGIFLDLKCHDIPRTVERAVVAVRNLGVELLTVHAAGGRAMLEAAHGARGSMEVVAVTVLTSLSQENLEDQGISLSVPQLVEQRLLLTRRAGLAGVVASGQEASLVRSLWPQARVVVPGVRLGGESQHDHGRVTDPRTAVAAGATDLVVGRPITTAERPREVLEQFLEMMKVRSDENE